MEGPSPAEPIGDWLAECRGIHATEAVHGLQYQVIIFQHCYGDQESSAGCRGAF